MTEAEPCTSCGLQSELGQAACSRLMHYCTQGDQTTVEQIIERMGSLSNSAINRIIDAGEETQRERFYGGVFE